MNLAALVLALRPLLADVDGNWANIVQLLDGHRTLAEYEVARHAVSRAAGPRVRQLLGSVDPRERCDGLDMVRVAFSRAAAAQAIRPVVKDPDERVRRRAWSVVTTLGLDDVALRSAGRGAAARGPLAPSGWNPTGWTFGLGPALRRRTAPGLSGLGLPRLNDQDDVAALVGLADASELRRFMRPGTARGSAYVEFDVPKASGGSRRIAAPRPKLRRIQRTLLDGLLAKLPVHDAAHGFVVGRSTVTNARPHAGAAVLVRVDLKDFFPSVHYRRVVGLFEHYGYGREVASTLAALVTWRPMLGDGTVAWPGVIPQGAPTSPALANLVSRRLDARLTGLAKRFGAVYTRYADDLSFSFRQEPEALGRFLWWVDQVCQQEGFSENPAKRRVFRPSGQQRVTGIVVNAGTGLRVPRELRRRLRAIIHNCQKTGLAAQARGTDLRAHLLGMAAYIHMVDPAEGAKLLAAIRALPP